ncbi:MAG: YbhB/YbcL family Raf kinase inhibitor-like protein [Myxococcales bacterium]|nr:YbhB/YbcL family Raf kinase inhibitor-like protein [Myxococcales bacterium]
MTQPAPVTGTGGADAEAGAGGGTVGGAAAVDPMEMSTAGAGGAPATEPSTAPFALTSVVAEGEMIAAEFRCEGPSPMMQWTAGPEGTQSYAIVFKDVTPGFSEGYLHWLIYDIPAATTELPQGVELGAMPASPTGARQAPIWNGMEGYNGPCAPFGLNTYVFTLHALDVATLPEGDVEQQIASHSLGTATLMVTSMP